LPQLSSRTTDLNYFNTMENELHFGDEMDAYGASLVLPHLGKQMDDYSGCHRWFYAKAGHIFSLHEDSQTLALLTGDTFDLDEAHEDKRYVVFGNPACTSYMELPEAADSMKDATISYITREALMELEEQSILNSAKVKEAKAQVAETQTTTNEIELF